MSRLRWGVLGTSHFAQTKMLPALQQARHVLLSAIASRDLPRAQAVAARFGITKAYGSYEELIGASDIDVIYNPLPNHLHVPWSIKALEAGKHVLCEKPVAMSATEAEHLERIARHYPQLKLMEAFMYRFHPQWQYARQIVMERGIGELSAIHSIFSYFNVDDANIRNQSAAGGGGLMDIGCYNISLSRFIFGTEPKRVLGILEYDPAFQTDRIASGILDFGRGAATFTCSTQLVPYQRVHILGTEGRIEIEIPFNAPPDKPCRLWHQSGNQTEEIRFEICDQYMIQADQFSLAVLNDTPVPTPLTDAVANMKTLEAVRESGRLDAWVTLST
jgi:predicted dehydrogenase